MSRTLNLYRLIILLVPVLLVTWFYISSRALLNSISFYGILLSYVFYLNVSFLKISSETVLESSESKEEVMNLFESDDNPIFALFEPYEEKVRGRTVISYSGKDVVFEEHGDTIKFTQRHEVDSSYEVEVEDKEKGSKITVTNSAEPYSINKLIAQVLRSRYVFNAIQQQDYDVVSGHESLSISDPRKWELDLKPFSI